MQRARAGSDRGRGQRAAFGRDGVPDRRADAVAARDRHAAADVLPAGAPGGAACRRTCGAAWYMITGSRVSRSQACDMRSATRITCASCKRWRTWTGRPGRPACSSCCGWRRTSGACRCRHRWCSASSGATTARSRGRCEHAARAAGVQEAAPGPQPGVAAAGSQECGAALRPRSERPVHEQPSGAGPADDEAAHEDLRRVPVLAGCAGLRHAAQRAVHRAEDRAATASRPCCKGRPPCNSSRHPAL